LTATGQLLRELDLRLVKAVDTHLHADHVTGLGELARPTHCVTIMGERARRRGGDWRRRRRRQGHDRGPRSRRDVHARHTDDSYSYLMGDRVFTGDTLLIRGTGRTDFPNGRRAGTVRFDLRPAAEVARRPMVFPAHDYKGDTVSTIGEEKRYNPRLQVRSVDEYIELMNNLKLAESEVMDVVLPANMHVGLHQDDLAKQRPGADRPRRHRQFRPPTSCWSTSGRRRTHQARHAARRAARAYPAIGEA